MNSLVNLMVGTLVMVMEGAVPLAWSILIFVCVDAKQRERWLKIEMLLTYYYRGIKEYIVGDDAI